MGREEIPLGVYNVVVIVGVGIYIGLTQKVAGTKEWKVRVTEEN